MTNALIVSSLGSLEGASAGDLEQVAVRCILSEPGASVPATVEAAALQSEDISILCLVGTSPPTVESLVLEDALRYIAAEKGRPLAVLRIDGSERVDGNLSRSIALIAVALAGCGVQ